jgi:hypothetical protein
MECGYRLYDEDEAIEHFGQDYLDDYGRCVDEKIIERYKKCMNEYNDIQTFLKLVDNL